MNYSFPALESFELFAAGEPGIGVSPARFEFPAGMLMGSAASLQRLDLKNVFLNSLSQLLSSTIGLVDLTLHIDTVSLSPAVSLLAHLQRMSCLRSLELQAQKSHPYTADGLETSTQRGDIVALSKLTRFYFDGSRQCLEAVAAGLSAPFLQDLKIHLNEDPVKSLPHLSRFIRDVEGQFFAAQVKSSREYLEISVLTHSHFIDEPACRITIRDFGRWKHFWTALKAKFTAIEEIFFESPYPDLEGGPRWCSWLGLLEDFDNIKTLRVERGLVLEAAHFLKQRSALDFLPALEEIELRSVVSRYVDHAEPISDIQREAVHTAFRPFVTARQQTGRPVKISWNADLVLPRPYM
ncbi:hypothetical protein BJV78DRAFT_1230259 [Lactifluus subvellereus]|nr:hypothetical protein BJV78DRAFT_1230259 [Lactifluus subvellereus]